MWRRGLATVRLAHLFGRAVLLVLMAGVVGFLAAPAAGAEPVRDLSGLPSELQPYVPGSAAWASSPWMTSPACAGGGGDFSVWVSSVIRDTPSLLAFFQASVFGPDVPADTRPRSEAIIAGYRALAAELRPTVPAGYCVDDLRRWAGGDPAMRPFGFRWGVTQGHQTGYYCTDRDLDATAETERNRWFGAERAPCDGFYVGCLNAPEVERDRCEAWNAFSDRYVRKVEQLRAKAINDHPAAGRAGTEWELRTPEELLRDAAGNWFQELSVQMAEAAGSMMAQAMTFWVRADQSALITSPVIANIQALLRYVGVVLLAGGVLWQGIVMMYRRKVDPLVSTGMGLLSFVGWSTLAGTLAVMLDDAGTALTDQLLDQKIEQFSTTMGVALQANVFTSAGAVFLLSIVLFFLAAVQWALGFFRMGALVILLALIPTAAAGQVTESTKPWLRKVLSWCLALVLYKPVAAIVFSIGFTLMADGKDLSTVLVGMAVLSLAVLAMPTMLRFFDWGGQRFVTSGGGGGAMAAGAAASVLGGAGAAGFGRFMDHNGPASGHSGGQSNGAVPVAAVHSGDGPGGSTGDQSGSPTGSGGAPHAGASSGPGAAGGEVSSAAGQAGGTGAAQMSGPASTGGAAAAAAGPAGAVVAGAQAAKAGASATVDAATAAMTDGAPEGRP